MNIFEFAVRNKLRFPYKGQIDTEQLFDLKVEELDKIFKTLNAEKKQSEEESLLATKSSEDVILEVKIAIIKHIVEVKQAEKVKAAKAKEDKEQRQKIMGIISEKKDAALRNLSVEELEKLLAEKE